MLRSFGNEENKTLVRTFSSKTGISECKIIVTSSAEKRSERVLQVQDNLAASIPSECIPMSHQMSFGIVIVELFICEGGNVF